MRRGTGLQESREAAGRRGRPWETAGLLLALVAGPPALGLLARAGPRLVDRFTAWWPPAGLDLMPLAVAGLVVFITAFALATHGRRARRSRSTTKRRFLPPLDLLLLQLGNVSFLAFALVLAVVALGLLSSGLRLLVLDPGVQANGFALSLGLATVTALVALARRSRRTIGGQRRRRAALLGLAASGLWLLVALRARAEPTPWVAAGQPPAAALLVLYASLWIVLAASVVAARSGKTATDRGDRQAKGGTASATLLLTWAGYLGFLALYLDGALLTMWSLLAAS